LVWLLVGAVCTAGCGKPTATVSGTVKYKGQLIPAGTIKFIGKNEEGKEVLKQGKITNGSFSVAGVPPGKVKVGVSPPPNIGASLAPAWMEGMSEQAKAAVRQKFNDPSGMKKDTAPALAIPPVYSDPYQSNVTIEVQAGANTKDIDLPETDRPFAEGKLKGKKLNEGWKNRDK
jgi:hypothetical protein